MPKIIVTEAFKFAHHGYKVEEFEASDEPRETTDEVAAWVAEHGRGRVVEDAAPQRAEDAADEQPPAESQAAPENKDAAPQRSTKPRRG